MASYFIVEIPVYTNDLLAISNKKCRPRDCCGSIGKKNAESMQFWTTDEFRLFAAAISDKPASYAIFNTLFWTGMRSGELLALTLNDIDFESKKISITKSYARVSNEDVISPPKTPKSRRVIIASEFLLEILKDYAGRLVDYEPSDRLFDYTKHFLASEMTRGCKLSGVKKYVFMTLAIPTHRC